MAKIYLRHLQQKNKERGVRLLKKICMSGMGLTIILFSRGLGNCEVRNFGD